MRKAWQIIFADFWQNGQNRRVANVEVLPVANVASSQLALATGHWQQWILATFPKALKPLSFVLCLLSSRPCSSHVSHPPPPLRARVPLRQSRINRRNTFRPYGFCQCAPGDRRRSADVLRLPRDRIAYRRLHGRTVVVERPVKFPARLAL